MKLFLIRHPQPRIESGICYGREDLGLREPASVHALRLRALLPERFGLYCSPLQRALKLARELGEPILDPRLQEMNFGEWEGRPYCSLGTQIDDWAQDPLGYRPPQGETGHEVAQRIWSFHLDVVAVSRLDALVVVGHSGPFRLWLAQLLGLATDQSHRLRFQFAKVTALSLTNAGAYLEGMNL